MSQDTRSRKWQLTINNPADGGFTHENIKELLDGMKLLYYCLADEKGQTPHTHIYIHFANASRFSTIKNVFPTAHIEMARGTAKENREYIAKEGKWEKDEKHGTKVDGTFEEWGEMPIERQGQRSDLTDLYDMIRSGLTTCEIYEQDAGYIRYHNLIEQVRQDHRYQEHKGKNRDISVIYLWGKTGVGKTRMIYETYCSNDIYRVTDYQHPFDSYQGEPVMVFDEFRSQLRISDMLNYIDRYPLKLPSRYVGKQACYIIVYLVSNEPLRNQYREVQTKQPDTWQAFLRRIHKLYEMVEGGTLEEHDIQAHVTEFWAQPPLGFVEIDSQEELPF